MTSLIALLGLSAFMWQGTSAPDISGQWSGEEWSSIELEPLDDEPNWYTGQYVSAEGDDAGTLQLSWSRLQRRFDGQWKRSGQRYGDISIRVMQSGEIRGALTVDAAVQEAATVPRLRDFVWTRKQDSRADRPTQAADQAPGAIRPTLAGTWQLIEAEQDGTAVSGTELVEWLESNPGFGQLIIRDGKLIMPFQQVPDEIDGKPAPTDLRTYDLTINYNALPARLIGSKGEIVVINGIFELKSSVDKTLLTLAFPIGRGPPPESFETTNKPVFKFTYERVLNRVDRSRLSAECEELLKQAQGTWERQVTESADPTERMVKEIKGNTEVFSIYKGDTLTYQQVVDFDIDVRDGVAVFTMRNMRVTAGPRKGHKGSGQFSYTFQIRGNKWIEAQGLMNDDGAAPKLSIYERVDSASGSSSRAAGEGF